MPGPRPTPTHLRLLRGNPGKRPIRNEPQPAIPENMPSPPSFLGAYAQDEWWTTGVELYRLGLLTVIDVQPFAAYCQAYHLWRTAIEKLREMAANDPVMAALIVKTHSGGVMQNPLFLTARQCANDMLRYAAEFGLTPAARARIASAGFEPPSSPNKFDGLLG
jgi:P27 family predicted phage terminase small subunit